LDESSFISVVLTKRDLLAGYLEDSPLSTETYEDFDKDPTDEVDVSLYFTKVFLEVARQEGVFPIFCYAGSLLESKFIDTLGVPWTCAALVGNRLL